MSSRGRCNQCHEPHEGPLENCPACRERLKLYATDRGAYLASRQPRKGDGFREDAPLRVRIALRSNNRKLKGLPVVLSSPSTCPTSCDFRGDGCFAEFGFLRHHWERTPELGVGWAELLRTVRALPKGAIWRYAEAGDLPGRGDELDLRRLRELVDANAAAGARGFTFTHKPLGRPEAREAIRSANARGFTINLSASKPADVPRLQALGIGPVVSVIPTDAEASKGQVVCLYDAQGIPCSDCELCTLAQRKSVIVFPAHGQFKRRVSEIAGGAS